MSETPLRQGDFLSGIERVLGTNGVPRSTYYDRWSVWWTWQDWWHWQTAYELARPARSGR